MRVRTMAIVASLATLVAPAQADDKTTGEVLKALNLLNDAFTKPDPEAIRRLMTADHVAILPYKGVMNKDEQIRTLPHLRLSEYKTGKQTVRLVTPDVAIISYSLRMKGTFQGKPVPMNSHAVAVWVRREGKWQEASYQETALERKP